MNGTRLNFVRLPAGSGAEVVIQSERPLPSAVWLVVGQIAELLKEVGALGGGHEHTHTGRLPARGVARP